MNKEAKRQLIETLEEIRLEATLSKRQMDAIDDAIEAIRNPKPEWIPCKDQMPENSDHDTIVATSGGGTAVVTNYNNGFNCTTYCREHEMEGILAWFYLPEEYEEEAPKENSLEYRRRVGYGESCMIDQGITQGIV
jgi:hypothetical protein